ncbi:hypothetical protein J437_LFUL019336 [Ladona fulva]|uniref:DDE Tnp4 domain-containing protein n=1 Tax=Ladona fulva TaxID=123851 RepID=A0A8K0KFG9_LADFU|nr:hypothetical protein J437_LFUL019336 [Ladona fulva]
MEKSGFPGVIGAVDGTHIEIVPPVREREHDFANRKGFQCKNVQIVCGYDLEILSLNAQHGGRTHDAHIWRMCQLYQYMRRSYEEGDQCHWFLRDSGYPLQPWLMTSISNPPPDSPEERYNARHRQALSCVEKCIGVWKAWFMVNSMHHFNDIIYKWNLSSYIGILINACAILHNMALYYRVPHPAIAADEFIDDEEENEAYLPMDGVSTRRRIVVQHFA